jgi:DNA polymerase-3 subunit alpha
MHVHLRCSSHYSIADGMMSPDTIADACKARNIDAVAILDSNRMHGALESAMALAKRAIKPMVGISVDIAPCPGLARPSLGIIARDATGWKSLLELAYAITTRQSKPSWTEIAKLPGLICLARPVDADTARAMADSGMPTAAEIDRAGLIDPATEDSILTAAGAAGMAAVGTIDVRFKDLGDRDSHQVLMNLSRKGSGPDSAIASPPEGWLMHAEALDRKFADLPTLLDNACALAKTANHLLLPSKTAIMPKIENIASGTSTDAVLAKLAQDGLEQILRTGRLAAPEQTYRDRMETELTVIHRMQFDDYFLVVHDFTNWARRNGIAVGPGRGSAAGSLVLYALGVTNLDPIRWGLLFERFLNPDRVSMPDVDMDFCARRRDEVVEYIVERYGRRNVAAISTITGYNTRAAIRAACRHLELPMATANQLSQAIPYSQGHSPTLEQAEKDDHALTQALEHTGVAAEIRRHTHAFGECHSAWSKHAAGIVISNEPIDTLVPVAADPLSGFPVIQYAMTATEKAGLVKYDILALKNLTIIQDVLAGAAAAGRPIDIDKIPFDDRDALKLIARANTHGIFQLASGGIQSAIRTLQPERFEDLIALVSLYRPGPIEQIPHYAARKAGKEPIETLHPLMDQVLKETFGIIVYQEQIIEIVKLVAKFTAGAADLMRRAIGKKNAKELEAQRTRFMDGCAGNGIDAETAQHIFALIEKFADYGFNKSHATAYALIGYQTAYLKAHEPSLFATALLNADIQDHNATRNNLFDARVNGLAIVPSRIGNCSDLFRTTSKDPRAPIQYGIAAIKTVGAVAAARAARLIDQANPAQPNRMLPQLRAETLTVGQIEALINAGVFDTPHASRAQLIAACETGWAAPAKRSQKSLFEDTETADSLPKADDKPETETLAAESAAAAMIFPNIASLPIHPPIALCDWRPKRRDATTGRGKITQLTIVIEDVLVRMGRDGTARTSIIVADRTAVRRFSFIGAGMHRGADIVAGMVVNMMITADGQIHSITPVSTEIHGVSFILQAPRSILSEPTLMTEILQSLELTSQGCSVALAIGGTPHARRLLRTYTLDSIRRTEEMLSRFAPTQVDDHDSLLDELGPNGYDIDHTDEEELAHAE